MTASARRPPAALDHPVGRRIQEWNEAIATNQVTDIAEYMTQDWVLVDPAGGLVPRDRFLGAVSSGQLVHHAMTHDVLRISDYGTVVVETSRGYSSGAYRGEPMEADEWVTCVWVHENGQWRCSLTQLSPITAGSAP